MRMASFCNYPAIQFAVVRAATDTAGTPPMARAAHLSVTRAELLFIMSRLGRAMQLGR
jgi:hypothetical protein